MLVAVAFAWWTAVKPLILYFESADWPKVPCTITASHVEANHSDQTTQYRPQIDFQYVFEGQAYKGGDYTFDSGAPSSEMIAQGITERYPIGLAAECYVNPASPETAVLVRRISGFSLIVLPFALMFVLAGIWLIWSALRAPSTTAN